MLRNPPTGDTNDSTDSSNDTNVRLESGLEMLKGHPSRLSKRTGRQFGLKLIASVCADPLTWERWRGVKGLEAWRALALHHHLDPGALAKDVRGSRFFTRLRTEVRDIENNPIELYMRDLTRLGRILDEGLLPCVKRAPRSTDSVIEMYWFDKQWSDSPVIRTSEFMSYIARPLPSDDGPLVFPCLEVPKHVRALFEAAALWRTVTEGGTVVPGDVHTHPDVDAFLLEKGISKNIRAAIVTILRRDDCPKGRHPKSRGPGVARKAQTILTSRLRMVISILDACFHAAWRLNSDRGASWRNATLKGKALRCFV